MSSVDTKHYVPSHTLTYNIFLPGSPVSHPFPSHHERAREREEACEIINNLVPENVLRIITVRTGSYRSVAFPDSRVETGVKKSKQKAEREKRAKREIENLQKKGMGNRDKL